MLKLGFATAAIVTMLGQTALASEKPTALRRLSCTVVRFYVARYSEVCRGGMGSKQGRD